MRHTRYVQAGLCIVLLLPAMAPSAAADVIYVDSSAAGANDGSIWQDAYRFLQDALWEATAGDQIWVAAGVYEPDRNRFEPDGTGDRTATFQLKNGVVIFGAFPPGGSDMGQRDPDLWMTVLSGDLLRDDVQVVNADDLLGEASRADNSFHVVNASGCATTALNGFAIRAGQADGPGAMQDFGGGLYCDNGNPIVTWCRFMANAASTGGGACYVNNRSQPLISDCNCVGNYAGTSGGAVYSGGLSRLAAENCRFAGNAAAIKGGAVCSEAGELRLAGCVFRENYVSGGGSPRGGAVYTAGESVVVGCRFADNRARDYGGGIYGSGASLTMTNCLFVANSLISYGSGGAICATTAATTATNCAFIGNLAYNGAGMYTDTAVLTNCTFSANRAGYQAGAGGVRITGSGSVTNCVLWGNRENDMINETAQIRAPLSQTKVTYSCIQGGWSGCPAADCNNTNSDPRFIDADGPDDWIGTEDDDLRLSCGSPCIDTASNIACPNDVYDLDGDGDVHEQTPLDLGGGARFVMGIPCGNQQASATIDMGAYEFVGIPQDHPDYQQWLSVGCPCCWCYPRQCHGDADGRLSGSPKTGYYYVGPSDLNSLIAGWQVKEPPHGPGIASVPDGICADFDRRAQGSNKTGFMRVGTSDLNILVEFWMVKEPPYGSGLPPECNR